MSNIRRTARQCFGSQIKKMHETKHAIPFSFLNAKYIFEILWLFNKTQASAIKSKSQGMDQSNMNKIYSCTPLHAPSSCLVWNYGIVQTWCLLDLQIVSAINLMYQKYTTPYGVQLDWEHQQVFLMIHKLIQKIIWKAWFGMHKRCSLRTKCFTTCISDRSNSIVHRANLRGLLWYRLSEKVLALSSWYMYCLLLWHF